MKMLKSVKVMVAQPAKPGTGRLVIEGWEGEREGLEIAILENQNRHYLQEDGSWRSTTFWFSCPFVYDEQTASLQVNVGAFVVNPLLLSSGSVMHRLMLRSVREPGQISLQGIERADGLLPDTAAGSGVHYVFHGELQGASIEGLHSGAAPAPAPAAAEVVPSNDVDAVQDKDGLESKSGIEHSAAGLEQKTGTTTSQQTSPLPPDQKTPPETKDRKLLWIGFAAAALVAGAAAAWFLFFKQQPEQEPPSPAAAPAAAASTAAEPCSVQAMQELGELAFVQGCLAQSPSSEIMLQTIQSAKDAGQCGVAQRLYANRAQAGDLLIAEAYAKEYDPQFLQPSKCFAQPEPATAAYWWETIASFDAKHALAAQRLKELQP